MLDLIPQPKQYDEGYGEFVFHPATTLYAPEPFRDAAAALVEMVQEACGFTMQTVVSPVADVRFLSDHHIPEEGYRIRCTTESLFIDVSTPVGARYAVESIRQLTYADRLDAPKMLTLHAMQLSDSPRYRWRGLMLDEARHFFGIDVVKGLLDQMVRLKLNVLHWHLSDNEGWRVEIKRYPALTEIGGTRRGTQKKCWLSKEVDWTPVTGYYTQQQIKEVVAYASQRGIMVVPEIDMPAHFGALLSAIPELSCRGATVEPAVIHNEEVSMLTACIGKEHTFEVLYNILDEIVALFPSPYVHIGGDEAPKREWKSCPDCQRVMAERGLKNEAELQGYFTNKIAVYLQGKGKRVIGWNEVLGTGELQSDLVVQYWTWQRDKRAEEAARQGRQMVLSKHQACYFDMPYGQNPLKKTYLLTPAFAHLQDEGNVLGYEGELWTEWVMDVGRMQYQYFPRAIALAEAAWSETHDDYRAFKKRLKRYLPALDKQGIRYAPEAFWDQKGIRAWTAQAVFAGKDAHREYNRYLRKVKHGKRSKNS